MMKDFRRENKALSTIHMINYMKRYYHDWVEEYSNNKENAYESLLRLCREFAKRYGFSFRRTKNSFMTEEQLLEQRNQFAQYFWTKHGLIYSESEIYNVDETGIKYMNKTKLYYMSIYVC